MKALKLDTLTSYIVPVVSLLVVLLLIPLVILPQLNKIANSSAIINKNRQRLNKVEEKANKLEELAKQKDDIEKNLDFVETVLPINKEVAALVLGVQDLARNSGLSISTFKIQPGKTATDSATPAKGNQTTAQVSATTPTSTKDNLVFNLNLTGNLSSLRTFLASLESGKRILTLSQVKSSSNGTGSYTFDLFLNAPFGTLPVISSDQESSPLAELTDRNKKLLDALNTPQFTDITGKTVVPGQTGPINPFVGN